MLSRQVSFSVSLEPQVKISFDTDQAPRAHQIALELAKLISSERLTDDLNFSELDGETLKLSELKALKLTWIEVDHAGGVKAYIQPFKRGLGAQIRGDRAVISTKAGGVPSTTLFSCQVVNDVY